MNMKNYDRTIWDAIQNEIKYQEKCIKLIASENYASLRVMQAQGSHLTNKYAEGYPGKRYYGGCKYIDLIEQIAIDRAKKLFNADFANVQPHSGSQANAAVYMALLNPGDKILGMDLTHGGHLSHGASVNFSGKFYNSIFYGVDKNGIIDYKNIETQANNYKPKMIIGGFSSYSRTINWKKMRKIADSIGAYLLADIAHVSGLVATGIYPNPIPYAHVVTTTTHKTLSGPRGGLILASGGSKKFYKKINSAVFPGIQGGPLMHVIAAKAIALKEAMNPKFKIYQKQICKNSKEMANIFIARRYKVISHGTDNHLFLLDLNKSRKITGKKAENALCMANIIVNRNTIPNDLYPPTIASGIRIGSPSITNRGFKTQESIKVANWICDILDQIDNKTIIKKIKQKVLSICKKFPIYPEFKKLKY